ncbi:RNA-dependent RNA polymerase [Phytophthora condilina negative stranded RNA virus 13]|nr:RNA-dependent RNA polymerase [Phytophthora condilina negative stranded RNA virus 13]
MILLINDIQVDSDYPVIPHLTLPIAPTLINYYDAGGAGDCFLRSMNHVLDLLPNDMSVYRVPDVYKALGLQEGDYLEDDHISRLMSSYKVNLVIVRKKESDVTFSFFDCQQTYTVYILNFYPNHFCPITSIFEVIDKSNPHPWPNDSNVTSLLMPYDQESCGFMSKVTFFNQLDYREIESVSFNGEKHAPSILYQPEILIPTELEEAEEAHPTEFGDNSGSDSDRESNLSDISSENEKLPYCTPTFMATPAICYAYFCDSVNMTFPDPDTLIETFRHTHNIYVRTLAEMNDKDQFPHESYLKAYYKFRHNVFAALCIFSLTGETHKFDTDVKLTKWLPDCLKTPDFVVETEQKIFLYEFTVGNSYERIDYIKGGGNTPLKYTDESKKISEVSGKICKSVIIPAVLDSYNMEEISEILGTDQYWEQFQSYFDIANEHKIIISSNYVKSWNSSYVKPPETPGLTMYDRPNHQQIVLFPHDAVSGLSTEYPMLLSRLEDVYHSRKFFQIVFDLDRCKYYLRAAKAGKSAKMWLNILNKDLGFLISQTKFQKNGKDCKISQVRGTIPITVDTKSNRWNLRPWIEHTSYDSVYLDSIPKAKPGYGDPELFDDSMIYDLGERQPVAFPPDYFHKLCSADYTKLFESKSTKILVNNNINEDEIQAAVNLFKQLMLERNTIDTVRSKPTFLFGLVSVPISDEAVDVPRDLCDIYLSQGRGKYTKSILKKAKLGLFATTSKNELDASVRQSYDSYHEANSSYYRMMMQTCQSIKKQTEMSSEEKTKLEPYLSTLSVKRKEYQILLGKGKKVLSDRLVRLNIKSGTNGKDFEYEMQHYNRTEGITGLGLLQEPEVVTNYFSKLCDRLVKNDFLQTDLPDLFDNGGVETSPFLNNMKQEYRARWTKFYHQKLSRSMLMMNCFYYERLAKFLFNESLKTYGNDYVKVDNLGLSDVLVMCRGGAKLYKHQRSRLYRVMFPVSKIDIKYSGYLENDSFELFETNDKIYVVTPWSQVHQDILFDYMFAPSRSFNQIYSISSRTDHTLQNAIPKMSVLPTLLMFHNRRKTEKFLHNSRYLIVNSLGRYANMTGIMDVYADVNYTYLDGWLRHRILDHFSSFSYCLTKLRDSKSRNFNSKLDELEMKDLWFGEPIPNTDLLTLFIYSTYMMTKAPVNSSIEQVSNLWEILNDKKLFSEAHKDVKGMEDYSLRCNVLDFNSEVYDDDFKYDPVFSQYLGHYMASYLSPNLTISELHNKWDQISNSDMDVIANSNGLRGYNTKNFFNRKGYDIVYTKIDELLADEDINQRIEDYLSLSSSSAALTIQADRTPLIPDNPDYDNLVFHIVHKIQRGGSREIFCMDLNTKRLQYPIERFFAYISKKVPNEFISVPSGQRHGKIHTDFYEKKPSKWVKHIMRWVLDCRRWAPHSVFQKYTHFVIGMAHILPPKFLEHFYAFSEGMMKKRFVTRKHVISKMENNKRFAPYKNLVKSMDLAADAVGLTVEFSFVMGIFNYLSTLMHAANQLVASEVIRNQCLFNGKGLVILDPKCHSDDSVVTSYHEDYSSVKDAAMLYDWLLKCANHMLSVKKSQLNENVYLEFLSTLYIFDRFLPVFPKFISTIPFKPTDEGLMSDVSFAASQAIEMLTMGGSLEESYLIMKTTDHAIRRVYNLPIIEGLPPHLFGPLDAHPIELLYSGSNADLYNFYLYDTDKFWSVYNTLHKHGLVNLDNEKFTFDWDMGAILDNSIKRRLRDLSPTVEILKNCEWTVKNCKLGNSTLNLIWYYLKMNDRKFRSSLVDEPVARRMSRIFGSGSYRRIKDQKGNLIALSDVYAIIKKQVVAENLLIPNDVDLYLNFMSSGQNTLHESLIGTEVIAQEVSNVKEKPITVNVGGTQIGNIKLSASDFVSYIKEPEAYKLLGKFTNPAREAELLTKELSIYDVDVQSMPAELLHNITRKMLGRTNRIFRLIGSLPSGLRYLDTYSHMLTFISSSSYSHIRLTLRNNRSAVVDWERKLVSGRMPQNARDYMQLFWTMSALSENEILHKDLYIEDLFEKERQLAQKLSDEWKMILLTTTEQRNSPLVDISHWCYWEKEQVKMGTSWVGSGVCVIKLPEAYIRLNLSGGNLIGIDIFSDHSGFFSQSSSWYLHNILRYSAVSAQMFDPMLAKNNELYLGVTSNTTKYGLGRSNMFDSVLEVNWLDYPPVPTDFYKRMRYEQVRSHYEYYGSGNHYYIDFFIPVEDPIKISFEGIFDLDKLALASEDEKVSSFVKRVAIDVGGLLTINKEFMIDNIGSSSLYNLIYNAPDRGALIRNEKVDDYLPNAFADWKRTHPDFGYPTEDQMEDLIKDPESPPFPKTIMKHLLNIGKSNIDENEYRGMLLQLSKLHGSDRISFLTNNFAYLDSNMRTNALVLASKSKIIYKSCFLIDSASYRVFVELLHHMGETIEANKLNVSTLLKIKRNMYYAKRKKYSLKEIIETICICIVYESLLKETDKKLLNSYKLLYEALEEAFELGLGMYMNTTPSTNMFIKSIDFNVSFITFINWIDDLVYSMCNMNLSYKKSRNTKVMLSHKTVIDPYISSIKARLLKFSSHSMSNSITVKFKKKTMTLKAEDPIWGITTYDFEPMDEENQEEVKYSMQMECEEDIEDLDPEEDSEIPQFGFTNVNHGNLLDLSSGRGGAWNMFIKCNTISSDIRRIKGIVKIFKKSTKYYDLTTYIQSSSEYIIYLGKENANVKIENYKEINFEQTQAELAPKVTIEHQIEIDGKKYNKKDFESNIELQMSIYTFDQYFKKMKMETVEQEGVDLDTLKKVFETQPVPDIEKSLDKLQTIIDDFKKVKNEEGEISAKKPDETINYSEMIQQYLKELEHSETETVSPVKEYIRVNYSNFNYSEPMRVLSDIIVRSELNCLLPGQIDSILNSDIRLSKKTKDRILRYARLEISQMPKLLRKKYNKLLLVIKAVLNDIEECFFMENETLEFVSLIDDLFHEASEAEDSPDDLNDLLPDDIEDKVKFDLSKIL